MSEKVAGEIGALHVAEQMKLDRGVDGFGHGPDGAGKFAEVAVAVAGLDRLDGGAQGALVLDRLGHELQLRAEGGDLRAGGAFAGEDVHGSGLCVVPGAYRRAC